MQPPEHVAKPVQALIEVDHAAVVRPGPGVEFNFEDCREIPHREQAACRWILTTDFSLVPPAVSSSVGDDDAEEEVAVIGLWGPCRPPPGWVSLIRIYSWRRWYRFKFIRLPIRSIPPHGTLRHTLRWHVISRTASPIVRVSDRNCRRDTCGATLRRSWRWVSSRCHCAARPVRALAVRQRNSMITSPSLPSLPHRVHVARRLDGAEHADLGGGEEAVAAACHGSGIFNVVESPAREVGAESQWGQE